MNARLLVVASLLPLAAVLVVSTAFARSSGGSTSTARLEGVNFVSRCTFSHTAPDDPIVYPGKPGLSHDHTVRRQHDDERVVHALLAPRRRHDVPAAGGHGGLLDAHAPRRQAAR